MDLRLSNVVAAILLVSSIALAQPPAAPLAQRGLDLVALRDGPALMAAVVGRGADGTLHVVVERDWLRGAHPKFYEQVRQEEADATQRAFAALDERITRWQERRRDERNLAAFLALEARRIEREPGAPAADRNDSETQLLWMEIPPAQIRRVVRQSPERKQVALLAWRERLPQVATASAGVLERELRDRDVALTAEPVDLSDRLPPRPQDDREWAARVALVEHHFVSRFELQGTGSVLIASDGEGAASMPALIGEFYRSEVGKLLEDVAGGAAATDQAWIEQAQRKARERSVRGVRVTRVEPDLTGRRVTIESRFLAEVPDGTWETIWQAREVAEAARQRPEAEQRIRKDPQVRQAIETLQAAGLQAERALDQAVRFGAATLDAQRAVNARFQQFQDRYLRRLDGPPLVWSAR